MNTAVFWVAYLVFMIPTYFIRLFFPFGFTTIAMIVCLLALVIIGIMRGLSIGKPWLFIFPIIALVFDLFLLLIPFVPTVMHIITLVLGSIVKEQNIYNEKKQQLSNEDKIPPDKGVNGWGSK